MANYLVWYGKKRAIFLKRESELVQIVNNGGPAEQLLRAAVDLRDSKIRYLNAEYSRLDLGDGRNSGQISKIESMIAEWSSRPPEIIVTEYQRRAGLRPHGQT